MRLAVVRCLYVVPLDEFDQGEIEQITKIVSASNNIGAGQTELVLSTIYWICCKLASPDTEEVESNRTFQTKFGEQAVNEALDILMKNSERVMAIKEEDDQKYALSLSILNFLKQSTEAETMHKYMRNKNTIFKQILIREERYSSDFVKEVPVDIESTYLGREISSLIETISGVETVSPYSDASFRVISRMADILMNRNDCKPYEMKQSSDGAIEELMDFQKNIYKKRKKQELDYWVDVPARFLDNLEESEL